MCEGVKKLDTSEKDHTKMKELLDMTPERGQMTHHSGVSLRNLELYFKNTEKHLKCFK